VNKYLEKGKRNEKDWNDDKLSLLINNCLDIEKSIKIINIMNQKIKKYNSQNIKVKFYERYDQINNYNLEKFGYIDRETHNFYQFRQCPLDIEENKKYIVYNKFQNIATKVGNKSRLLILTEKHLGKRIHCWKIRILKTWQYNILLGVANSDFDNKSPISSGWFICLCCGKLFSGSPNDFKEEELKENSNNFISDEIILIMKRNSLSIYTNSKMFELYSNIPLEKSLYPANILKDKNDSLEILNYKNEYYNYKDLKNKEKEKKEEKMEEIKEEKKEEIMEEIKEEKKEKKRNKKRKKK